MKIYCTKDILLNVYQQPFAAPADGDVLSAIAQAVNNQENMSAIAQAPHHFQIWKLGEVTEDGHLIPNRELLAEASSLIRPNIRRRPNGGAEALGDAASRSENPPQLTS